MKGYAAFFVVIGTILFLGAAALDALFAPVIAALHQSMAGR